MTQVAHVPGQFTKCSQGDTVIRSFTRQPFTSAIVLASAVLVASCGGGIEGIYSASADGDPNGPTKIELKSGGKATFTFTNQPTECTYAVDQKKITLDCKDGNPVSLTLSDDNTTLIMPPGSLIPNLKKKA
jgi:hypothetical protein